MKQFLLQICTWWNTLANFSSNPAVGGSLMYFFTITESKTFHIHEGETVKNSMDLRVGLKGETIDEEIVDKVLEIAARDYLRRNS
jgi:hypothetical protein